MFESLFDVLEFMRMGRKYWLVPIVSVLTPLLIVLSLVGRLRAAGEPPNLAPFIYTLF